MRLSKNRRVNATATIFTAIPSDAISLIVSPSIVGGLMPDIILSAEFHQQIVGVAGTIGRLHHRPTDKISSAHQWVADNVASILRHKGEWLAIADGGIVASAVDFDQVRADARAKGIDNPLVFKVPQDTTLKRAVSARRR